MGDKKRPERVLTIGELHDRWDRQSEFQEWKEAYFTGEITRKDRRHLKEAIKTIRQFADCRRCPNRDECEEGRLDKEKKCAGTCPAVEMWLLVGGESTEGLTTDKIITEADWRPSQSPGASEDGKDPHTFFEDYISRGAVIPSDVEEAMLEDRKVEPDYVPQQTPLAKRQFERGTFLDVIGELFDGKATFEQIAEANFITAEVLDSIRQWMCGVLGLDKPILKEWQRIIKVIIDERLTTGTAARLFKKKESHISRIKRDTKGKLSEHPGFTAWLAMLDDAARKRPNIPDGTADIPEKCPYCGGSSCEHWTGLAYYKA